MNESFTLHHHLCSSFTLRWIWDHMFGVISKKFMSLDKQMTQWTRVERYYTEYFFFHGWIIKNKRSIKVTERLHCSSSVDAVQFHVENMHVGLTALKHKPRAVERLLFARRILQSAGYQSYWVVTYCHGVISAQLEAFVVTGNTRGLPLQACW